MIDKTSHVCKSCFKSLLFINCKFQVKTIVELKYHEKKFKVPTKLSIFNVVFTFAIGRDWRELRNVLNMNDSITSDYLVIFGRILKINVNIKILKIFIFFF